MKFYSSYLQCASILLRERKNLPSLLCFNCINISWEDYVGSNLLNQILQFLLQSIHQSCLIHEFLISIFYIFLKIIRKKHSSHLHILKNLQFPPFLVEIQLVTFKGMASFQLLKDGPYNNFNRLERKVVIIQLIEKEELTK